MHRLKQIPLVYNKLQNLAQNQEQNKKFWSFSQNQQNEDQVELRISGEIIDDGDAWLYEWFGIPCSSPNNFRKELSNYKGKNINVWIDTYGGDTFAGIGIYNALKSHDGKVTTIVDGKAISSGSIILMAGDEVKSSLGGVVMVHNPWTSVTGEAKDLLHIADMLKEIKEAIINIYESKTKLSREIIAEKMDNETFMSAKTAIKEGFVDSILDDQAKSDSKESSFSFSRVAIQNSLAASMERFIKIVEKQQSESNKDTTQNKSNFPGAAVVIPPATPDESIQNIKQEVKKEMDIKNAADLKMQLPEIHNEVYNSGVAAEKLRLKAFDALIGKVDPEFLANAKYEEGASAESVFFKAMQEGKLINSSYVANAIEDAQDANHVPGSSSDNANPDEVTGVLSKVSAVAKKTLGIEGGNK